MGKKWTKFKLLMWKNYVLQKRSPIQTIIEVVAPILFSLMIVFLRGSSAPTPKDAVMFESFLPVYPLYMPSILLYSPKNDYTEYIMGIFDLNPFLTVIGFNNPDQLIDAYRKNEEIIFAGIQFPNDVNPSMQNLNVSIRFPANLRLNGETWQTNLIYPPYQMPGPRAPGSNDGASPIYQDEYFFYMQSILSVALLAHEAGISSPNITEIYRQLKEHYPNLPNINLHRYPYPAYNDDPLLEALMSFCGVIILLSFVYPCINTVKAITTEKEKQLKEAMKIMGLSNWLHWTAWFIKTFIFLFLSCIIVVILFKIDVSSDGKNALFQHGDPSVMIIFLLFYTCGIITFCFAVSVFFSKANTAATISGLLWFLSYAPYMFLQNDYQDLSLSSKLLSSLGINSAMAFGFQLMLMYEGTGDGIQWNNVFKPVTPDDNLTLGALMGMLLLDVVIYFCIAMYVENVFPGEYGVALPWNYPFTKSYWTGKPQSIDTKKHFEEKNSDVFEKPPENLKAGVKIQNLRKEFGKNVAVNNLSLNMYEDQITVLLGHNGAGKTTTMSMLTGMFTPTSGTALINGHDIRMDMPGVRDSLGLCPQHNIIFDNLTVSEHLYFFSKLKGLDEKDIKSEINKYINLLELEPKRDARSKTLSGGMKRKLCVGMALCGNSKVIMLDEPTAGMDPSARRALWEFLQCQKEGRTMLLTTHFMDEADLLGDRIAIMAGGQLQCCGSSFFLKKKYGAGYHLIMDKSKECNTKNVTALLRKHIPNIEIEGDIGSELTYSLDEDQSHLFEPMLKDLEDNFDKLGIRSYGISLTTLEEVFMKVGADHGQEEEKTKMANGNDRRNEIQINMRQPTTKLDGCALINNQIYAMAMKKLLSSLRSWIMTLLLVILPMIFLIIVIISTRNLSVGKDLPLLELNLDKWDSPYTYIQGTNDFRATYEKNVKSQNSEVISVDDITSTVLEKRKSSPSEFRYRYIVGALFNETDIIGYFNNDPYHSPGVAYSLVLNAVYQTLTSKTLTMNNYPLPLTSETRIKQATGAGSLGFGLSFNIGFSMSFASTIFILFIIRERVTNSKHLQMVSGVKGVIFWLVTFVCDYLVYLVMAIVFLITLICFQEEGFTSADELGRFFLIFVAFGYCVLPVMYWAGFLFQVPSSGYTRMTLISIFTGCIAYMIIKVLLEMALDKKDIADGLSYLFLLVPHYSIITAVADSYSLYQLNSQCESLDPNSTSYKEHCKDVTDNYYRWESPGIGKNLFYSFLTGFLFLLALIIFEYKVFSNSLYKLGQKYFKSLPQNVADEDSDVLEEKLKIRNSMEARLKQEYTFVMRDVTKYYKKFLAVNGLSLGAKGYECFGLLGVNGAGKTTTFKMMTGDIKMSYGDAWVNGYSIKSELKQVQKYIGYCPQFDALLDDLTPRETIKMFALLRGIPKNECNGLAEKLAHDFDFFKHIDKKVKELSGGNKRKLSTSIALIGDPPILYLDEPTTGMDPATKRFLWNALCKVRDSGKLIILTSHSMEECEALCTRIAIMVNGNFKCLGSTQHLKNKFAKGYTLTIKIKKLSQSFGMNHSETTAVEQFITSHFPGAVLREKHQELLTYYITDTSIPWSKMFGILEKAKQSQNLNIEDYSLGQSSLEQVFLTFTKQQM